jgi:alkanesulfonate monooxygenase SsuD/methylene tetrahydromethanopterin reductase-like flavin-dependent oxidoreductase (luciferase family)
MGCEVSWFAALCDDDYEFLGVTDPALQSSWEHCRNIALMAEAGGYDNLLDGKPVDFHGEFVDLTLDPPWLRPAGGCPPFYFGGPRLDHGPLFAR